MKLVIIESPYSGDVELNRKYLQAAMRDCLVNHGEAPFASHGLYTQPGVLNDDIKIERHLGITSGFEWRKKADKTVVYTDLGITDGMRWGIENAQSINHRVEFRSLEDWK